MFTGILISVVITWVICNFLHTVYLRFEYEAVFPLWVWILWSLFGIPLDVLFTFVGDALAEIPED